MPNTPTVARQEMFQCLVKKNLIFLRIPGGNLLQQDVSKRKQIHPKCFLYSMEWLNNYHSLMAMCCGLNVRVRCESRFALII